MRAKIALVVISDHAFIPSFAPYNVSMKEKRQAYIDNVKKDTMDFLSSLGAQIVLYEWVYDVESARRIASRIKETDFDLLIITVPIWPGGDSVIELAKAISNVPIVLWTPVTPMGHLCGFFEVASDLKSLGIQFEAVFGKTPEAKEQIKSYMRVATVLKKLSKLRIGQIGYTPQAFIDVTASEVDLRSKFGVEIAHLDTSELILTMNKVTDKEVEEVVSEFKNKVGEVKVSDEELVVSAKICVALRNIINKYKLDGYSLCCSPLNFEICHPCIAVSESTEKGVPGSCEGDLPSAIMLIIMYQLTGNPPAVLDIDSGNIERNILILWHCGHLATSLAESPMNIAITPPLYEGEVMGPGAVLFFPIKPGRVTIASLNAKGDRMLITTGEALKVEKNKGSGAYSEIKLDSDLVEVLRVMAENGFGHHLCVVHGDIKTELEVICKILKISAIVC
jgi:L-fucose isomerase-like protein